MRAFDARSIAVVPYFESELYRMSDDDLTPERVLALARETERRVLGVESPRPLLAIPHLLNQESAASYQGYLLADMAVSQTRAHFLREFGFLTDNPAIGPALSAHYWEPGNSVDHHRLLRSLTGEGFSARYLADDCNATVADAAARGRSRRCARPRRDGIRTTCRRRSTPRSASSTATSSSPIRATAKRRCAIGSSAGSASATLTSRNAVALYTPWRQRNPEQRC